MTGDSFPRADNLVVAVDFESFYDNKVSVDNLGPVAYARHPDTYAYLVALAWKDPQHGGLRSLACSPKDAPWEALSGQIWVSHNRTFDAAIFERLKADGVVPRHVAPASWECSSDLCAALAQRRALATASEFFLGSKVEKETRTRAKGRHWREFSEADRREMFDYARRDAVTALQLWLRLSDQWPEQERELSKLTTRQVHGGVAVDWDLWSAYLNLAQEALAAGLKKLPWFGEAPALSPMAIREQCTKDGIPLPPKKTYEAENFTAWESKYAAQCPWIPAVASVRIATLLVATLERLRQRSVDGRFYYGLKYFGAHTGRWAGDAGWNIQNIRRLPVLIGSDGLIITDKAAVQGAVAEYHETGRWPSSVRGAVDLRRLLIPSPGHRLAIIDLAQIEPRLLHWLAGDRALLKLVADGLSVYEAFARSALGWSDTKPLKADKAMYQAVKAQVLGLGYGCGAAKFRLVAKSLAGLDLNPSEALALVQRYRATNPRVTRFWATMDHCLADAARDQSDLVLRLPSWRALTYRQVRREAITGPHGGPKMVYTADVGRRTILWGGKLVENVVQAVARDVFSHNLLLAERETGLRSLWTAHDEAVFEIPDSEEAVEALTRKLATTPDWLKGCPIGAEGYSAACYLKK